MSDPTMPADSSPGVRFGLLVSKDDKPDIDPQRRVADHVERALAARDAGLDTIAVGHRYSYGPAARDERGSPLVTSRFQPLLVLAHLAAHLGDTMDYATLVLVSPSAHPVQLAEDMATLDAMTHGRLRIGIGLGWMPNEFEAFGVPIRRRVARFEELIAALRKLLTEDDVDFDGKFFQFQHARLVARPVQRPMPPLWIGASAEPAIRRAARLGDTWTMSAHLSIDDLRGHLAIYTEELERLGKPMPTERPITRILYLAEDRETAVEEARPALVDWYRKRGEWGWFIKQDGDISDQAFAEGRWIIGNPQDCVAQIRHLQETIGVNRIVFNLSPGLGASHQQRLRTIRLLGEEVVPAFRKAAVPR
jgi:alkanesulfonate monooxygenase SsuD/methylene tetrahydromethanopterin reductase-like flavin-dependent oxidoreductase (luciferase family)